MSQQRFLKLNIAMKGRKHAWKKLLNASDWKTKTEMQFKWFEKLKDN